MSQSSFKVLIAGGGPAGLVAAHSLYKAGIDFLVLEQKHTSINDVGASLVLQPQSLRVMNQLGLLDRLLRIGSELTQHTSFTADGREFESHNEYSFESMKRNHGSAPIAFHRAQLIEALFDGLPDEAKAKVLMDKKITEISSDDESVTATCADGTSYQGSVLIGADGVHSRTRREMRKLALKANPKADWDPEQPYTSAYRCLWGSFERHTDAGEACETQGKDKSAMYLAGRERGWIFLYEKLLTPTKERKHYTDKDVEDFAARFADYPLNGVEKVKDAFARRLTAGMSDLEEGIVSNWSFSRIVLVGDACHKFTPNAGLGFNNGIQDVVKLCNELQAAVSACTNANANTNTNQPSMTTLTSIFHRYHVDRLTLLQSDLKHSMQTTRLHAWSNAINHILARYVMTLSIVQGIMMNVVAPRAIRQALVLDYVPSEERFQGAVSWTHPLSNVNVVKH